MVWNGTAQLGWADNVITLGALAVSLSELKMQLGICDSTFDTLLAGYCRAAQDHIRQRTRRVLSLSESRRFVVDQFPTTDRIVLPYGPLVSVEGVEYWASDDWQTWGASNYRIDTENRPGAVIRLVDDWPTVERETEAVRVNYTAGTVGDDPHFAQGQHAIKVTVAEMFECRGAEANVPDNWIRALDLGEWTCPW